MHQYRRSVEDVELAIERRKQKERVQRKRSPDTPAVTSLWLAVRWVKGRSRLQSSVELKPSCLSVPVVGVGHSGLKVICGLPAGVADQRSRVSGPRSLKELIGLVGGENGGLTGEPGRCLSD